MEEINMEENALTEHEKKENKARFKLGAKLRLTKKQTLILGAAILIVIVIVAIALIPSKFERVKSECVQIAGQASYGKGYFTLDTYPDSYKNMDSAVRAILLESTQENTLEAIKYANKELGFNDSLYGKMLKTSALMGRQTEENSKYKVSWTYHPDNGLEVTYEKK